MIVKRGEGNFSEAYRPCRISEIRGQEKTKTSIKNMLDSGPIENALLFHGPPGTGKTTLARIIGLGMLCVHNPTSEPCCICPSCRYIIFSHSDHGYFEYNVAAIKGIEDLRRIAETYFGQKFAFNERQVFVFDECQEMTKVMQTYFLDAVENAVKEDIFIFCSTELKNFSEPLRDRFTEYEFKKLEDSQLYSLINDACENEKIEPNQSVLENIAAESNGKARKAMKNLKKAFTLEDLKLKQEGQIEHFSGKGQILVVAPHGAPGSENDDFTSDIAKRIQSELGCYAVINEKYSKTQADLNIISTIQKDPELETEFLHRIREYKIAIKEKGLQPLVIYIHGAKESSVKRTIPTQIGVSILIGYGQGKPGETRITLTDHYLESLGEALKSNGLSAVKAPPGSRYCGWAKDNLNQIFNLEEHKEYYDPDVHSVQLEIAALGLRGNAQEATETGKRLSEALKAIIQNQPAKLEEPLDDQKSVIAEIKKVKIDDTQLAGGRPYQVKMKKIADLRPHPLNREIYGDPNLDDDLKHSIQKKGILTPLIISEDDIIVSGHRRFSGAKEFGIKEVPVIILPSCDDLDIKEKLIVANIQRQKTKEQIAREYEKLKIIEVEKSKIRMSLAGGDRKSEEYKKSPAQNSAEPISKGESRKKASAKLGISHDTAEKALKVVNSADELRDEGKTEVAQKLLDTLNNKSVNSAYKNVKAISEDPDILIQNTKPTFNKTTESIEWATWTWNPVTGCKAGCKYCYARSMTKRFPDNFPNGFEPTFYPKRLEAPANTSVPKSNHIGDRNVFVVSMGDFFGDWVKQEWIDAVLDAVRTYPQWNYLFLTKNPKRLVNIEWPDNAWVGTTVDCQARVEPAEEAFEKIKAKVKFLSCEPLSEEITFTNLTLFDWVIVGARSKTTEVPEMQPKSEWVKSLMLQAWDAGCKVYCKPNLKAGVKEYPLAEANDNIFRINANIQLETDHIRRYQELGEALKNAVQQETERNTSAPRLHKKVIFHDEKGEALRPQNKIDSHNFPFTLNTAIGCHFGCSYCYIQGFPFNKNTIFGQEVKVKLWIAQQLDKDLKKYSGLPQHLKRVQVNVATEGYLPSAMIKVRKELDRDIMAEVLEVFRTHWQNGNQWAVHLITKSHMVLKHLDIISAMRDQVQLEVTITTLNENRKKLLEGFAPSVKRRLEIIRKFAEKDVFVRAMCMPLIGDKKDAETIKVACFDHGAKAFKHKGVNYWDENALLDGNAVKESGRQDEVFEDLLENSSEPILENDIHKKMIVKMPVIIKSGKSKRWQGYKEEDLQDKEMIMENSGYRLINDIDWGYIE